MLDQFRSLAGSLPAKLLLGLLVLSFGVWGIGDMVRQSGRNVAVATVGGTTITGEEFARALRRETENIRRMMGERYSPELVKSMNLPQQVLHELVGRTLMTLESQSLGLVPGDAEVVRHIRSDIHFQDEKGNFDKALFNATLRNSGITEKTYVEQLRQDMASGLLIGTLENAVSVSDEAVRALYDAREEQRSVTLYAITPSLAGAMPQPAEAEISAYYAAHKNEFTAPEYRSVSYVTITPADAQGTPVSEDDLRAAYKERLNEFKRPERRSVEQLLYNSEDKTKTAEALLKGGKSFTDVARETEILNKDAVSLGKVERDAVPANAADAVFSLPVGGHTDPIQSPFGWHIFTVTAIEPPSVASFEKLRPQLEKDLKQRDAGDAQSKLANKLEDALAGGGTLQEAAGELKLKLRNVGPIDHQGLSPDGSKSKDMPDFDKLLDTAFKTDDQTESSMMTAKGGVYYILRVDSVTPERLRTLDEVRGSAVADWQKEERGKRLSQLAKDIAGKFTPAAVAQYNLKPIAGALRRNSSKLDDLALPPELVADIFRHKPQESTAAYLLDNGDYLIAVAGSVIPAPNPDKDPKAAGALADIRSNLQETEQNEILDQYTRHLAEKYPVSVNEAALEALTK